MKNNLKIGDRVNVTSIVTETWQTEKFMNNVKVTRIHANGDFTVTADDKSNCSPFHWGGRINNESRKIELV